MTDRFGVSDEQNKAFWANLPPRTDPPAPLKRTRASIKKLMVTNPKKGERAIRAMAEKPEFTHEGRHGRRLAAIYGVEFTRFEDRTPDEQEELGMQVQVRKERESNA